MPHNADDDKPGPHGWEGAGKENNRGEPALSDVTIADYLRDHPDFLIRHPDLIETLVPPESRLEGAAGGIVLDLHRFMLERLRGELCGLRNSHDELVRTGRNNLCAQARVHEAVLALLSAPTFERLIETITDDLAILLDLDVATLCVERRGEGPVEDGMTAAGEVKVRGLHQMDAGNVAALLGPKRRILLREAVTGDPDIFGPMAGLVRSDALIRLTISPATPPALLALGSREVGAFHPNQGSELLDFLARSLEVTVRAWLDLPD